MQHIRLLYSSPIKTISTIWRRGHAHRRSFHTSHTRHVVTQFTMPAMSPTMTEGGIAEWKKKEGETFSAGDVLLEIETDKATIDVEAQDDGILGRIIAPDGSKNVPVGKIIALVAESDDDLNNLEIPKDDASEKLQPTQTPKQANSTQQSDSSPKSLPPIHDVQIHHSRPLFPSVQRLLLENGISNADEIKGTGVRGMLTKGDVLAFLGKASSPLGTYKEAKPITPSPIKEEDTKQLDGLAIRQLIVNSLLQASKARSAPSPVTPFDFESIIADYIRPPAGSIPDHTFVPVKRSTSTERYFESII